MKKLLATALLACVLHMAYAQTHLAPPAASAALSKDDDTILLPLSGSPEDTWRQLAQVLGRRGYSLDYASKDLLSLSTHPLYHPKIGVVQVAGMVINDALVLRLYTGATADTGGLLTRRRGGENDAWRELEAIAQSMGGKVRYSASEISRL